jgi:ketosteroid isomerase-like protein
MKRLGRLLVLWAGVAGAAGAAGAMAQQPDQLFTATREQLDVAKIVLDQEKAWNKGNMEMYLTYYKDAPETEAMLGGPVRGLANIRNAFHANFPNREAMGALEQSEVSVRELDDKFAIATGKYHLSRPRKSGGDAEGTFAEVFERTPSGWQIVFSVTT